MRSFQTKLAITFGLLILAGGLFTTVTSGRLVGVALTDAAQSRADDLAEDFANELAPMLAGERIDEAAAFVESEAGHVGFVFVVRADGSVIGRGPADVVRMARRERSARGGTLAGMAVSRRRVGHRLGTLWVGLSLVRARRAAREVERRLAAGSAIACGIGILLATMLAAFVTRPIGSLATAAVRMGEGDLAARAEVSGRDELAHLGTAFNRMAGQLHERIAQAEELRRYFEDVFEHVPVGIVVADEVWKIRYANSAIRATFGDAVGRDWTDALGGEVPGEILAAAFASSGAVHRTHRSPTGRTYELAATRRHGTQREVIVTLADVTEVTDLAQRVRQVERLAAAGEVAAGIVHAINNPLDGVMRALSLAKRKPEDRERVSSMLDYAIEGTDRIASVTRMLLDFARAEAGQSLQTVSPNALVEEALQLVTLKAAHREVGVRREIDSAVPDVRVEPHGIIEALLNLLMNGLDACRPGGEVVATTRFHPPETVEIAIHDDGTGIPAEHLPRIFEPFFTTKEAGKGTGLGLAVARRIVHANAGELTVESVSGAGTTFRVRLPRAPGSMPAAEAT